MRNCVLMLLNVGVKPISSSQNRSLAASSPDEGGGWITSSGVKALEVTPH